jgi:hypothetical protein
VPDSSEHIDWLKGRVPLPTDHVLEGLGFKRNDLGNYARQWGGVKMIAPEWLGGYHFSCTWVSVDRRTIGCPEFRVPRNVAPAILLAVLYDHCGEAFGRELNSIRMDSQHETPHAVSDVIAAAFKAAGLQTSNRATGSSQRFNLGPIIEAALKAAGLKRPF